MQSPSIACQNGIGRFRRFAEMTIITPPTHSPSLLGQRYIETPCFAT